jgi:hypothetical protein
MNLPLHAPATDMMTADDTFDGKDRQESDARQILFLIFVKIFPTFRRRFAL